VSDGSGQSKVCNKKKKGDQFPIYVQGAFLTGPSKIFTDYIVNPIKKVSEFTYQLALAIPANLAIPVKKPPCMKT